MKGLGTIVNVLAIIVGGGIGAMLYGKLKVRFQEIIAQACGLSILVIGLMGALQGLFVFEDGQLETTGSMLMIFALIVGSIFGEGINIERMLDKLGGVFKRMADQDAKKERERAAQKAKNAGNRTKSSPGGSKAARVPQNFDPMMPLYEMPSHRSGCPFVDGFVISTLIFCFSSMALNGAVEEGINGDPKTLYIKAAIDFVLVFALAVIYGGGAGFSAVPVLVVEGAITLFAGKATTFLTPTLIGQLSFIGSVLIMAMGINLAFGKKFRVANMVPSLFIPVIYYGIIALVAKITGAE